MSRPRTERARTIETQISRYPIAVSARLGSRAWSSTRTSKMKVSAGRRSGHSDPADQLPLCILPHRWPNPEVVSPRVGQIISMPFLVDQMG
jgi:hypothetical protein